MINNKEGVTRANNGEYYIVTVINNSKYEVNVTSENVRSMVKSVIDRVALKF